MKFAYFPGCSLNTTGLEYGRSTRAVATALDITLQEIPDWNCCGASSAHCTDDWLSLVLPARNLALAEQMGLDVVAPCAGCFSRLRAAESVIRQPDRRAELQEALGMPLNGEVKTCSLLDLLANRVGIPAIQNKVVKPLTGLRLVCYYGCLLVRPPGITGFDDPENPQSMDQLMKALGAAVLDWPCKTECCGGNLATPRTDLILQISGNLLKSVYAAGAEAVVTACPLCMINLDARQKEMTKQFGRLFQVPVFYFTELIGLSMGFAPETLGLNRHFTDTLSLLSGQALI